MSKERNYYVYGYLRLDTNTYFYIGQGHGYRYSDINKRTKEFKNIIDNYDFCVEIIKDGLTKQEALELEQELMEDLVFNEGYSIDIPEYCDENEGNHLVNHGFGGKSNSGQKFTKEHRQKISDANKGKKFSSEHLKHMSESRKGRCLSEETKRKLSESRKGENAPNYGKHLSEETKLKLSIANKGRKIPEEVKRKMSESHKGTKNHMYGKHHTEDARRKISEAGKDRKISEETRKKLSKSRTGERNPNYGKRGDKSPIKGRTHSQEELNKMRMNNKKRKEVYCIELNKSFYCLTYAENYIKNNYNIKGFNRRTLANRLNKNEIIEYGQIEEEKGVVTLHWKYIYLR